MALSPLVFIRIMSLARPNTEKIDPYFLDALLQTDYSKSFFQRAAKQTTNLAMTNKTQLSSFPVVLPPIGLQLEFCKIRTTVSKTLSEMEASALEMKKTLQSAHAESFVEALN